MGKRDPFEMGRQSKDPEVRAAMAFLDDLRWRDLLEPFTQIAERHGALVSEMFSRCRSKHIVTARVEAWLYLRNHGWSYPSIGRLFDRDHTTVIQVLGDRGKRAAVPTVPDLEVTPRIPTEAA